MREILASKKGMITSGTVVVYLVMLVLNATVLKDHPISEEGMQIVAAIVSAYLIGQGIADHGESGKATGDVRVAKAKAEIPVKALTHTDEDI